MYFVRGEYYHVYNRGNNQQRIFFSEKTYLFFLQKIRDQLTPRADFLANCLMPNHFHFILRANEEGLRERPSFGGKPMQELAYRIGILLSSYSQAINKQNSTTGSLFQQKTKAKSLMETGNDTRISYIEQCFHYIHQNPLKAGIIKDPGEWNYSSYAEYVENKEPSLCKKELFYTLTGLKKEEIVKRTIKNIDQAMLEKLL
jgi:putative transposase